MNDILKYLYSAPAWLHMFTIMQLLLNFVEMFYVSFSDE